jgi:phosphatidate cytidylyltransferase
MHRKRWITGIVALPFLVYPIYEGGIAFLFLILVASLVALWEYFRIAGNTSDKKLKVSVMVLGYITAISMATFAYLYPPEIIAVLLGANFVLSGIIFLFLFKSTPEPQMIDDVRTQIQGLVYIALPLSLLVLIRNDIDGIWWIAFLLTIIFAGDTSSFYTGTHFGKNKLSESISPGKTIEGSVGGLLANILVGSIFKFFLFPDLTWGICIIFFIAIGAAGQVGDLFESALKRMAGVKDSGGILPGHGGILDRIDALLFAIPVMFLFKFYALHGL